MFAVLCATGVPTETLRVRDRSTSPSASSSYQVRGSIYHAYNFQLTVPSSRIERLLDPTTYIYASHVKPQTAMSLHIPANLVLLCYLLAAQPLPSMHARIIFNCYHCYSLDWDITLLYSVVDDMIH